MKVYKIFRKVLAASAITGAMFVMQACYGTPVQNHPCDDEIVMDDSTAVDDSAIVDGAEVTENAPAETEIVAE